MKSVLPSIKPKWCELIANGKKTIEVRKTRPKLETPFKCYIYCTKETRANMLHLYINGGIGRQKFGITEHWRGGKEVVDVNPNLPAYRFSSYLAEGKVIGEFVCDYILEITPDTYGYHEYCISDDDLNASCLTVNDLWEYANGKTLYGWHISDLVIYDVPRELSEFVVNDKMAIKTCRHRIRWGQPESVTQHGGWIKGGYCCTRYSEPVSCEPVFCENYITKPVSRPPQSWCYVEKVRK